MSNVFTYDSAYENIDSSVVKAVYYDKTNSQMLVRLEGDRQYLYNNVAQSDVLTIAGATSPGSAYNKFRKSLRFMGRSSKADGMLVYPRAVTASHAGSPQVNVKSTVTTPRVENQSYTPLTSLAKSSYEVDFEIDGTTFTSTVESPDLVSAAQDVAEKTKALGLTAKLVRAAAK